MKSWAIILCEGAHDQRALVALARVCGDWAPVKGVPKSLPPTLRRTYPEPKPRSTAGGHFGSLPDYLYKDDRYLLIRNLGGIDNVLGETALYFLEQVQPNGIGVLVDASQSGVKTRLASFRTRCGRQYPQAGKVKAGLVSGNDPRLGIWVAPNNRRNGRFDELLLKAAALTHKELVARGRRFATSLEKIEPGKWTSDRDKAILGAINQVVKPGASLDVALQASKTWFEPALADLHPFKQLLRFIDALVGP